METQTLIDSIRKDNISLNAPLSCRTRTPRPPRARRDPQSLCFMSLYLELFISAFGLSSGIGYYAAKDRDHECPKVSCELLQLNLFNFCNIHVLPTNLHSVELYLFLTEAHFLKLVKITSIMLSATFSIIIIIFKLNIAPVYATMSFTLPYACDLHHSRILSTWLTLESQSITKYVCSACLPPISMNYVKFLDYLNFQVE